MIESVDKLFGYRRKLLKSVNAVKNKSGDSLKAFTRIDIVLKNKKTTDFFK